MDANLISFMCLAPLDLIEYICNYLDFVDFLSLSSSCRIIRVLFVSNFKSWINFYLKRLIYRKYGYIPSTRGINDKYSLNTSKNNINSTFIDPLINLITLARKVGILSKDDVYSLNPILNLCILDNYKRSRWRGDYTEHIQVIPSKSNVILYNEYNFELFVLSNGSIYGYNLYEDKILNYNINIPKYVSNIKLNCWVDLYDYGNDNYFNDNLLQLNGLSSSSPQCRIFVMGYKSGADLLVLLFYYFDSRGFYNIPGMVVRINVQCEDILSCICISGVLNKWDGRILLFKYLNIYIGTNGGHVYQYIMEYNNIIINKRIYTSDYNISSLKYIYNNIMSILIIYTIDKYIGIFNTTNYNWDCIISINDYILNYSIDTNNFILGYLCKSQNRCIFIDLYKSLDFHYYNVNKTPLSIISLNRNSKWGIIVRNYIRIIQIVYNDNNLIIKPLITLNGHKSNIINYKFDGWSKIITIDSTHQIYVWDYINGNKLFSFSLLYNLGSRINNIKKKGRKYDYIEYASGDDYDSDKTPSRNIGKMDIHSNTIRGLLKIGDEYNINLSIHTLSIYYKSSSTLQVISFK